MEHISSIFMVEEPSLTPAFVAFLLSLLSNDEDGSDIFLRNIRLSPNFKALQPRRPYSS
jgi:hypothetical protein